ncbi:MAG: N-acetyl-gamma-glutamyl-phosphate reductase [Coriobacteriia bacterium]
MVDVAIVGAAGYAGIELVRLVLGHPRLNLVCATSGSDAGRRIASLYPALEGATELVFSAPDAETIGAMADVAFLAVPHTAAMAMVPALLEAETTVIDLSADFRLRDPLTYEAWYGVKHTAPELISEAAFGLPELDRSQLPGARLVACPGCYPTATVLAAYPAIEAGIVKPGSRVVADAKSGVSGAGRTPTATTHYVSANESVAPYAVTAHRHTPEIAQALGDVAGQPVPVLFTPHLIPMSRGLLSTVYLDLAEGFAEGLSTADAVDLYRNHYAGEPFVYVHDAGRMPSTAEVRGSNRAAIGLAVDQATRTLIAVCAIDNLVKGAAGQALQCANAVLGYPETEGLDRPLPVV